MAAKISSFREKYFFLSNFYMASVTYNGYTFTNNEAAFQAQKCKNQEDIASFVSLNPSQAKRRGRHTALRGDWEEVKTAIMYDIVLAKFTQNQELKAALLDTWDACLEEGNDWGDHIWGTVDGVGENRLGKILMDVRSVLAKPYRLVVVERENGWYGGYVLRNGRYEQVFNTDKNLLFMSVKSYTDKGYSVACLDKSYEKAFMEDRPVL